MNELFVGENKSFDPVRFYRNRVRIYLNRNFDYGLWIDEDRLFNLLSLDQKRQYLADKSLKGITFQVSKEVALQILNLGISPYKYKVALRENAEV